MESSFYAGNRSRLYDMMDGASALVLFSGTQLRKTNDEYYPFHTDRSFIYLTGLDSHDFVLLAVKEEGGSVHEQVYILPPDAHAERWMGRRLKPGEVESISGIKDVRYAGQFDPDIHALLAMGNIKNVYLDLYKADPADQDRPAHRFLRTLQEGYPFANVKNANQLIRKLRLIKQPCEIAAIREAEKITYDGITSMMKQSKPGMYEYEYKGIFDRALANHGPQGPAFPSIISAGKNNFCIHYYSYTGQAHDGDMVLNDVGGMYDNLMTDVSRGWPCNGRYSEKQKLLFDCALATSNHMFSIIKPGMKMADVDKTVKEFNAPMLKDAGVIDDVKDVAKVMWHGGAHHVGWDVHDVVAVPEVIAPNMVFCVDVGIYVEDWGIGFRLEDNCLVTENGCENLSSFIPRTTEDIEDMMRH